MFPYEHWFVGAEKIWEFFLPAGNSATSKLRASAFTIVDGGVIMFLLCIEFCVVFSKFLAGLNVVFFGFLCLCCTGPFQVGCDLLLKRDAVYVVFLACVVRDIVGFGMFWYAFGMSEHLYDCLGTVKSCDICLKKTYCLYVQHINRRRNKK